MKRGKTAPLLDTYPCNRPAIHAKIRRAYTLQRRSFPSKTLCSLTSCATMGKQISWESHEGTSDLQPISRPLVWKLSSRVVQRTRQVHGVGSL